MVDEHTLDIKYLIALFGGSNSSFCCIKKVEDLDDFLEVNLEKMVWRERKRPHGIGGYRSARLEEAVSFGEANKRAYSGESRILAVYDQRNFTHIDSMVKEIVNCCRPRE